MSQTAKILQKTIASISDLPALPEILATLIRLLQDPRTTADDIGRAVSAEPALATKMLKLVNSAFYGFPGRIGTISQAVVILGHHTLRNLVLTTSVLQSLKQTQVNPHFDLRVFWEHSIATASAAKILARENGLDAEEAFIGGLLHDIGRLVITQYLGEAWEKIIVQAPLGQASQREAELQFLGFSHEDMGAWLARAWNFPAELCLAIEYHHQPALAEATSPPSRSGGPSSTPYLWEIVHVANAMAHVLFPLGAHDADLSHNLDPDMAVRFEKDAVELEEFGVSCREEMDKARVFLSILEE